MPSRDYAINQAWCTAVSLACDLLAWLQLLALTGDLATAEPTTLRYRLLHTAARLTHGQRLQTPENPRSLALGPPALPRLHHDLRPAATLTSHDPTRQPPGTHPARGTGAHPTRQPGTRAPWSLEL
ncbi:MAG: hypothetical protein ACRDRI_21480 [Pseudonocardiaceae bacterium]